MGQLPETAMTLIETVSDAENFVTDQPDNLALATQTTLSVDDTAEIVAAIKTRFPGVQEPHKEDICYATTNRQAAVKEMATDCDLFLVIGAETSSNSKRLVEVAERSGARKARLIASTKDIDWTWFDGVRTLGLTAGASAPEDLVQGVIAACRARYEIVLEDITTARETVVFKLPRILNQN
ncbi:MAG: 4-hydroxy-3-methylbut-2-enyl diphosphate reductase 1 [Hyphomonas sp. TMED17]|nr:MAG: 4-hydroxy-3-methylbut-2-enyl diphosphate reductase 1 [Hyphomonas sp. TMED17]